jgi:WD40 repeat protein
MGMVRTQDHVMQVYADRFMRFWDVHMGNCLHQVFTGHKAGETVMSVAVDTSDQFIATGDSAGYIKAGDFVWL